MIANGAMDKLRGYCITPSYMSYYTEKEDYMSTAISLRLPDKLARSLEALASSTDRPKSYLVRKALEAFLAEQADYQVALDRLRDKDDAAVSGRELKKRLGL